MDSCYSSTSFSRGVLVLSTIQKVRRKCQNRGDTYKTKTLFDFIISLCTWYNENRLYDLVYEDVQDQNLTMITSEGSYSYK